MSRKFLRLILLVLLGFIALLFVSVSLQLRLPAPTGEYAVGRTSLGWVDPGRKETVTQNPGDARAVVAVVWYPAEAQAEAAAPYFHGLEHVSAALKASGEVHPLEVAGLRLLRSNSFQDAPLAASGAPFPVLLLSPGNGTNVEFYAGLAEDLASHGYVVVGLNHPYDVAAVKLPAAVELPDGQVAGFYARQWEMDMQAHQAWVRERIEVRVQDARFVLEMLGRLNSQPGGVFAGRLDLERVGMLGHSLGGIAAAQACPADPRLRACLNLDGIQGGGAFAAQADPALPAQPFMFITKEEQLPPRIIEQFERLAGGGYVVTVSGASHDHFTDGPALMPSVLPLPNRADRVLAVTRQYARLFFDQTLKGQMDARLASSHAEEGVQVDVYPPL